MWLGREYRPSFQADQKQSCLLHTLNQALPTIIIYPALLLDILPILPLPTKVSRAGKLQLEAWAVPSRLLTAPLQECCQYQEVCSELSDNDGCAPLFTSHQTQQQPLFGIQLQKTIMGWNIAALRHYRDRQQSDQERNWKSSYKVSVGTKGK